MRKNSKIDLSTIIYGKVPPSSVDLEKIILGSMLFEPNLVVTIKEILKPSDFYTDAHSIICESIFAVSEQNTPELSLVIEYIHKNEKLDIIGGIYYLSELLGKVTTTVNIKRQCLLVKQKSIARGIIRVSGKALGDIYEDSADVFETLDELENEIKKLNQELSDLTVTQVSNVAMNVVEKFDTKVYNSTNGIKNENEIYTHIPEWDRINGSLFNGLYIVAGRPAMGKGVHLTELACRMGKHYDIGIINGEMSNEQLLIRMGCNLLNIDNQLWKKEGKYVTQEEQELVHNAMNEVLSIKIHLCKERDIHRIANKIRLYVQKNKVKVILADFLTIFTVNEELSRYMTDTQKTNYVLNVFLSLCDELKIPIILYVQMNREILGRAGAKEPNMGDLKSSGSIEELAYQVSFLHRPEYYNPNEIVDENGENIKDLCYQIIAKHRDGENGRIKHKAILKCSQMKEWDYSQMNNWKPIEEMPF